LNDHCERASVPFVFAIVDNGVIVIPMLEAQRLARLHKALVESSTWGEFLARVVDDVTTTAHLASQYGEELPGPADTFDATDIPGFLSGDWPTWPKQGMLSSVPASVRALGTIENSLLNGRFLHIDPGAASDVVEAMRREGLECIQDSADLVARASGIWQ
jgi:hypothetical protein